MVTSLGRLRITGLSYLIEEISRQQSLQTMTQLLFSAFTYVYNENSNQEIMKNKQFDREMSVKIAKVVGKVGMKKEPVFAKEISWLLERNHGFCLGTR